MDNIRKIKVGSKDLPTAKVFKAEVKTVKREK